jgi:hypothetical protein
LEHSVKQDIHICKIFKVGRIRNKNEKMPASETFRKDKEEIKALD